MWLLGAYPSIAYQRYLHVNGRIAGVSSLIMPSGPPVNGTSVMDDLTSLLRLLEDKTEEQEGRESDRELRRQDDERLRTQIFEEMERRTASAGEVASGVAGERCQCWGSKGSKLRWEFDSSW